MPKGWTWWRRSAPSSGRMAEAVTVAIPGAKTPAQARANAAASDLPALSLEVMAQVKAIYEADVRPSVDHHW